MEKYLYIRHQFVELLKFHYTKRIVTFVFQGTNIPAVIY